MNPTSMASENERVVILDQQEIATAMPAVLVIDDDRDLTEMLEEYLQPEGFSLDVVHNGEEGLALALSSQHSLIILDVTLPQMNGFEVLRRLRGQTNCPVIMLTARGQETDRIVGLEIGADDYLAKPFSARELLARMNAVLRRAQPESSSGLLAVGDIVLDERARSVRCNGAIIDLTSLEFDVLRLLVGSAGKIVSREEVFQKVLQRDYSVFDRSIDNHISSLRKKLGAKIGDIERIKSVRNAGYVYARTPRSTKRS